MVKTFFFFPDVNHEMDCRTGGVHPGTAMVIVPKVHCSREGFAFQVYGFILSLDTQHYLNAYVEILQPFFFSL